jgi:hypothetical protein
MGIYVPLIILAMALFVFVVVRTKPRNRKPMAPGQGISVDNPPE